MSITGNYYGVYLCIYRKHKTFIFSQNCGSAKYRKRTKQNDMLTKKHNEIV